MKKKESTGFRKSCIVFDSSFGRLSGIKTKGKNR